MRPFCVYMHNICMQCQMWSVSGEDKDTLCVWRSLSVVPICKHLNLFSVVPAGACSCVQTVHGAKLTLLCPWRFCWDPVWRRTAHPCPCPSLAQTEPLPAHPSKRCLGPWSMLKSEHTHRWLETVTHTLNTYLEKHFLFCATYSDSSFKVKLNGHWPALKLKLKNYK